MLRLRLFFSWRLLFLRLNALDNASIVPKKAPSKFSNKPSRCVIPAEVVRGMESIMGGFARDFNKPSRYVIPAEAVRGMESIMGGFVKI